VTGNAGVMSRPTRLVVGSLTAVCSAYFLLLPVFIMLAQRALLSHPREVAGAFPYVFAGHALALIVTLALAVFYIRHALRNPSLTAGARQGWAAFLLLFGPIAMPVYFLRYFRS